jgi:hypothetical protein
MGRIWLYRKPNTTERLMLIEVGNDVMWIKTLDDKAIGTYKKDTLMEFCQIKSDEGYVPDEVTHFTFTGKQVEDIHREDPCERLSRNRLNQ